MRISIPLAAGVWWALLGHALLASIVMLLAVFHWLAGLLWPRLGAILARGEIFLVGRVGWLLGWFLLGLAFGVIVLPVGLGRRLLGMRPWAGSSGWHPCSPSGGLEQYRRQFSRRGPSRMGP